MSKGHQDFSKIIDISKAQPHPVILTCKGKAYCLISERIPKGAYGRAQIYGYHTFDEGLNFYQMLEVFNPYIAHLHLLPSEITNILVVISKEETYIYANHNLPIACSVLAKRAIKAGEIADKDSIAGIYDLEFPNINPPENSGFLFLLSVGWRRGICFDFRPLLPESTTSTEESFSYIKRFGAALLSHLHFTEKFLLSNEDWNLIIDAGWFPFISIPYKLWESLFDKLKYNEDVSDIEGSIHKSFLRDINDKLISWESNKHLKPHIQFLKDGVMLYQNSHWVPCFQMIVPRIEGILRQAFGMSKNFQKETLPALHQMLSTREHPRSLLFPDQLLTYLKKVIYPHTDFTSQDIPPTRHAAMHGVLGYNDIGRKQALTLLLLIDHFRYCLSDK